MRIAGGEEGFSLIETLIATAIIATMMALTYRTIGSNAQAARAAADRQMAVLVGRSALDLVTGAELGSGLPQRGEQAGMVWRADVRPYGGGGGARDGGPPLLLVVIEVAKPGAARPLLQLETLKVER